MKASEARKLAENKVSHQLNEIINGIESSAKNGNVEMWYYKEIEKATKEKLEKLGYLVEKTIFERNECLTKISW